MGTDGFWDTFDKTGNPFGKEPLKDIIRQKAMASAEELIDEILTALERFRQGNEPEDDVTMVVIKIVED
jgi:sigma-B regulation protein RsbU (phosphoserine phosphatase)